MGKKRNSHLTNINKLMIPSAEEARQMYNSFHKDDEFRWNSIHDKLAEMIINEAKTGKPYLILNRDNFFDMYWPTEAYNMFKNDFVPMLQNVFKYDVKERDQYYWIIYFFEDE